MGLPPVCPPPLCVPPSWLQAPPWGANPSWKRWGRELTPLTPRDGLAADLGAGVCLLGCSLLGLPVSTTHTKVAAICGVGLTGRRAGVALKPALEIAGAWALTFPFCGVLSFALTRLMLG